jgi:hypothetical protein
MRGGGVSGGIAVSAIFARLAEPSAYAAARLRRDEAAESWNLMDAWLRRVEALKE